MKRNALIRTWERVFFIVIVTHSLFSCIPQKELEYLQDPTVNQNVYKLHAIPLNKIRPNDELYIRVSSFDDVAYNFFSSQTSTNYMNYSNDVSISLISYIVNDSGYIYFPILGDIYVKDLTIEEATTKLKDLLTNYLNQPTVLIKFVNKKITVLGQVTRPGSFFYTSERMNIFEALGQAGDMNIHGNRKEAYIIRTVDDSIVKIAIDLSDDDILFSENYYLQADDIVYVRTRNSIKWDVISVPISLVFSTITTAMLIFGYFR